MTEDNETFDIERSNLWQVYVSPTCCSAEGGALAQALGRALGEWRKDTKYGVGHAPLKHYHRADDHARRFDAHSRGHDFAAAENQAQHDWTVSSRLAWPVTCRHAEALHPSAAGCVSPAFNRIALEH